MENEGNKLWEDKLVSTSAGKQEQVVVEGSKLIKEITADLLAGET